MALENTKYVHGSVAENINNDIYDPYENNQVLKSKKIARNNKKIKAKIVFIILIVFAMGAFTMFRYAQISQLCYETDKLNKQYDNLQKENELLSIGIDNAGSLDKIREVAENKLQMHKPYKNQIIYVSVPKEDVTLIESKEHSDFFGIIKDAQNNVKKLLSFFY